MNNNATAKPTADEFEGASMQNPNTPPARDELEAIDLTAYQLAKLAALLPYSNDGRSRLENALKLYEEACDLLNRTTRLKIAEMKLKKLGSPADRIPFREAATAIGFKGSEPGKSLARLLARHGWNNAEIEDAKKSGIRKLAVGSLYEKYKAEKSERARLNRIGKGKPKGRGPALKK